MFDRISRIFNPKKDGRDGYTRWSNRIIEISDFILKNNRLPKANNNDKNEYNLYQSFSANKRKFYSKELSEKQLNFLEQHDIIFENLKSISEIWKNKVLEIEDFIQSKGKNPKSHYAFKKSITDEDIYQHKLYHTVARIRRAKQNDKLSVEQLDFLEQQNIIFENSTSNSDRWKNKVLEIEDFIIRKEHYPKANRKDSDEEKLYHALNRIRRAKEKGKLSVEQLDFLEHHNIILEKDINNTLSKEEIIEIKRVYSDNPFRAFQLYKKVISRRNLNLRLMIIQENFEKLINL